MTFKANEDVPLLYNLVKRAILAFVTISEFETDKQTWPKQGGSFELDSYKTLLDYFQQYSQTFVQQPPSGPEKMVVTQDRLG